MEWFETTMKSRFCLAMEIEEGIRSSPEICSNVLDSTKKRKLQSEQFDLPSTKHKCLNLQLETLITKEDIDLVEESESPTDSNFFAQDSDCAMSSYQHEQYLCDTIEEHLLEFGFEEEDYGCLESGNHCSEKMVDKQVNQNDFIISSGQFDIIQETIDREFEDFFSELMM